MNKQDKQPGDVLTAKVEYSEFDGGWEGRIHMSRLGCPGDEETTNIHPTRAEAVKATRRLCDRVWPNHEPIWRD